MLMTYFVMKIMTLQVQVRAALLSTAVQFIMLTLILVITHSPAMMTYATSLPSASMGGHLLSIVVMITHGKV